MKYFKKIAAVLAAVTVCTSAIPTYAQTNTLSVDEDSVVRDIPKQLFGVNFEWGDPKYYLKPNSIEINPEFIKCYEGMIPLARMAGLSANGFVWKNALGPVANRKPMTIWGNKIPKVYYGIVEWVKTMQMIEPDVKFTYTVNVASDTYENMADVVEFLTSDGTENPNGGVNWGLERKKLGIEDPVDIFVFEIGNELDLANEALGINVDQYIELCKPAIAAIRSAKRDAVIGVHTATGKSLGWDNWHRKVLRELGDDIDMVTNHEYYEPGEVAVVEENYMKIVKDIREICGNDRIKVYQSEHAGRRHNASTSGGYEFRMPHTMGGTLDTADFLVRAMQHPELVGATCHSTYSSSWCIAYAEDGTVKKSAVGSVLEFFNDYGVGTAVKSDFSGYEPYVKTDILGQAVKTDDGLNVFLINKTDSEQTVDMSFKNDYSLESVSYIKADNLQADNYEGLKQITVDEENINSDEVITTYDMPKYSLCILHLKQIGR